MRELMPRDIYWIGKRLPDCLWKLLNTYRSSVFVAGGFIRSCIASEPINDIDVFTISIDRARQFANDIMRSVNGKLITTENAFTVLRDGPAIQFIHRWFFEKPEECVASFDFTIASAAIWVGHSDHNRHAQLDSICDDDFYPDLAAKRLVYRSPIRNEDAGGSMLRMLKFYQRGYRAPLESVAAVMARMAAAIDGGALIGLQQADNLTKEQAIAKVFTGLLREVDPQIDPYHYTH